LHPALKPHRHRPSQERVAVRAPIPRAFPDSTIILIANGPSLTRGQINTAHRAWMEGRARVLGCNDAYRIAPWIDGLYAADPEWWEAHIEQVRDTHMSLLWCQDQLTCAKWGLWHVPALPSVGMSRDGGRIHTGREGGHSGFQLLNIAAHLGAKRVLLIGYDCHANGGKRHWFGDHPPPLRTTSPYTAFAAAYQTAIADLQALGVEVLNCSPGSAIEAFPRRSIGQLLDD
jgi:hypothetical protein